MTKKISEERKNMYKLGLGMQIAGGCLFAGPFIAGPISIMTDNIDSGLIPFVFLLAFIGFGLIAGGGIVRSIAARGTAGSGLVLDPEQAREDLQPWTEMGGGMAKDFLDAADIDLNGIGKSEPEKIIMIKCPKCGKLNEEDSKFCQECANSL